MGVEREAMQAASGLCCRQCDSPLSKNVEVCPICGETLLHDEERQIHGEDYRMLESSMEKPLEKDGRRHCGILIGIAGAMLLAVMLWDVLGG